jgi:hypothetical protein
MSTPADIGSPAQQPVGDRSLGDLISEVTQDLSTLMRQELELAKAELQQSASRAGTGAGMLGGAAVAGYFVLLFLSVALWWAIGLGWSALLTRVFWRWHDVESARRRHSGCELIDQCVAFGKIVIVDR